MTKRSDSSSKVRAVRLVVELGEPGAISRAVTVDLSPAFEGWTAADVVRVACTLREPPDVKVVAELVPIDRTDLMPAKLDGDEIVLGRARMNDIHIPSGKASRRHCVFKRTEHGFTVEDLQSANRTWVNGEEVDGARLLRDGDLILTGDVTLRYRVLAGRAGEPGGHLVPPKTTSGAPTRRAGSRL